MSVKKFIPLYGACRPMNFSEQADNLSWHESCGLFLFCHFSFGEKKNGAMRQQNKVNLEN